MTHVERLKVARASVKPILVHTIKPKIISAHNLLTPDTDSSPSSPILFPLLGARSTAITVAGFPDSVSFIFSNRFESAIFSLLRYSSIVRHHFGSAVSMTRARNAIVATGLLAFAAAGLSFPFFMATSRKPIDSSKPLPPQATFRGPYVNTGSRDAGPDTQTYSKK